MNTVTQIPLSDANLSKISDTLKKPDYDRSQLKAGILHFGLGAFARAHLIGGYIEKILNQRHAKGLPLDLGVVGVSLNDSKGYVPQLAAQGGLYTLHQRDHSAERTRIIGCLKEVIVGNKNPQDVVERVASPDIKLITLTVTQDGYHFSPNGGLNFDSADIKASLANAAEPKAAVAYLVEGFQRRMERKLPGLIVMSCDNVTNNGEKLEQTVLAYAGMKSPALRHWIEANVGFPNTMVDRITPAWKSEHSDEIAKQFGYDDTMPVFSENFKQFVIDGKFAGRLPEFDQAGATYVDDVAPYELAKIRLLNGAHMALGLIGRQMGHQYADEAIADPGIRAFMTGLMHEVKATLRPLPGMDYDDYISRLLCRLDNPYMEDELSRLARSGLSKVDSRFLAAERDARAQGLPHAYLDTALAAWITYLQKADESPEVKGDFPIADKPSYDKGLVALAKSLNGSAHPMLAADCIPWGSLRDNRTFADDLNAAYLELKHPGGSYGKNVNPNAPKPGNLS